MFLARKVMSSPEEDVFTFITILGLAIFIGLCLVLVVLIATSTIILVLYVIIDCILRPFLGTYLDLDLEIGVQRDQQQQRARSVTYHAIIEKRKNGLRQSDIETLLPRLLVGQGDKNNKVEDDGERSRECVICLSGYVVNEECRMFPICRHMYHALCIDAWLKNHLTCPTCRNDLVDS